MITETSHREQLREAILRHLAASPSIAFPPSEIARRIRSEHSVDAPFDMRDLADALALLQGCNLAKPVRRPLSGLSDWQATADGVLFAEQNHV